MQALTLSESVFRANLQPSCLKSLNLFNSSLFSLIPCSKKKSKYSHRHSRLNLSRHSRLCSQYANVDEEWLSHLPETSSTSPHGNEIRFHDGNSCNFTSRSKQIEKAFGSLDRSPSEIDSSENCFSTSRKYKDTPVSDTSFHSWLKFALLFGSLTLQGSQQAVAGPEFISGLQSIPYLRDLGDISTGFASAFLLIFFSELGDKTFFIAALLAARNSGAIVFIGTFGALGLMTIISVVLGRTFHYVDDILPFRFGETDLPIDDIAAVCLLVYFGVSTLLEAASSDGLKAEEEQKEAELAVSEFSGNGAGILAAANTVISTFVLVFVAEWGDKSFFSTIALAAASSPLGVIGGALAGHAVATLLAVLGGSLLGTFLSEKVIAYIGGVLFLVFATVTLVEILN